MGVRSFNVGFIAFFLIVLGFLFYSFKNSNLEGGSLSGFWAALIVIFLIFGVIVVSMYLKHVRERDLRGNNSLLRSN